MPVSLNKSALNKSALNKSAQTSVVIRSRLMNVTLIAIVVQVLFSLVLALLLFMHTNDLVRSLTDSNTKAKQPLKLCSEAHSGKCLDPLKQVHNSQYMLLGVGLIIGMLILWSARNMLHGIRSGRSMYVGMSVVGALIGYPGSPLQVLTILNGGAAWIAIPSALAGAGSVVGIVTVFQSDWKRVFEANAPAPSAARPSLFGGRPKPGAGAPRPSLFGGQPKPGAGAARRGSLFSSLLNPPPRADRATPARRSDATGPGTATSAKPSAARSKAKVRADETTLTTHPPGTNGRAKSAAKAKSRKTNQQKIR